MAFPPSRQDDKDRMAEFMDEEAELSENEGSDDEEVTTSRKKAISSDSEEDEEDDEERMKVSLDESD